MKISDIKDLSKDDVLSALGLASKASMTERVLGTLGIFGVGLLVGAGTALLLAPKSGADLRDDLGQRFRKMRSDGIASDDDDSSETDSAPRGSRNDEART